MALTKLLAFLLVTGSTPLLLAQAPADITGPGQPGVVAELVNPPFIRLRQSAEIGTLEPVQRLPKPDMFLLYTSQSYYHINNIFLSPTNPQETSAWVGALGLSFVPYSTYRWTPQFTVEGSLARYDEVSFADYNAVLAAFNNRLGLTADNMLSWNLGVSAYRAVSRSASPGEFFKRLDVVNNLNWFYPLDRAGRWVLHVSPGVTWRSADPSDWNRLDAGGILSVLWFPTRKLTLEPFFEGGYVYYPNDQIVVTPGPIGTIMLLERRDIHLRSGLNCLWQLTNHASVVASAYWLGNYSSAAGGDYQVVPYLTLSVRVGF